MSTDTGTAAQGAVGEDPDLRYLAVDSRDARFDGQFWFAVATTGIYCRPSCPSRTPAARNVAYFRTAAAARRAGYRACKRCLPDSVPGSPEWNPAGHTAGRAMQLIADGLVEREGVEGLAGRLGYSPRQLGRILRSQLGAGALDLARAHRTQTARELLVNTDLDMAAIAFASGFGSIRQFNDAFRGAFAMTPGQLRDRVAGDHRSGRQLRAKSQPSAAGQADQGGSDDGRADGGRGARESAPGITIRIGLPLRNPYDAPALIDFLARRAVAGVESVAAEAEGRLRYARTLSLPGGPGAFEVTFTPVTSSRNAAEPAYAAEARVEIARLTDLAPAIARIRRSLDLDADPAAIARVVPHPGIRLPGAVDGTEIAVRAIVGQQISVKAASTHLARLVQRLGAPYSGRIEGLTRMFPTASQLADGLPEPVPGAPPDSDRPLRLPARGVATVKGLARKVSAGELRLDVGEEPSRMRAALTALPGVGEWTAAYTAMRLLGDPDAWLPGDLYLKDLDPAAAADRYAPWRSYAVMYIWHSEPQHRPPLRAGARKEP